MEEKRPEKAPKPKSSKTFLEFLLDNEMGFMDEETGRVYTKVLDASAANGVR